MTKRKPLERESEAVRWVLPCMNCPFHLMIENHDCLLPLAIYALLLSGESSNSIRLLCALLKLCPFSDIGNRLPPNALTPVSIGSAQSRDGNWIQCRMDQAGQQDCNNNKNMHLTLIKIVKIYKMGFCVVFCGCEELAKERRCGRGQRKASLM
jgi:hypothetical protein